MPIDRLSRRTLFAVHRGEARPVLPSAAMPLRGAMAAEELTIGVVYVGARDDYGWNQSHAVGIKALKDAVRTSRSIEEENVAETDAVSKTMESMINLDGAKLILATSFGYYSPFVLDMAKQYPDVQFRHAAPLWKPTRTPRTPAPTLPSWTRRITSTASRPGCMSKSGKIGFVAAKPVGVVLRNINSFLTGARTVNPERHGASDLHG